VSVGRRPYNDRMPPSSAKAAPRVAVYLAFVQWLFALGWTVYVLFLPDLLVRAGVDRTWTPWVLALDQLIFAGADLLMGLAVDRARAGLRRIGPVLLVMTAISSLAMLLMPIGSTAGGGIFLGLTMIWVVTSAALRAPPFALLGCYAAKSALPRLVALQLFGLAAASALAPYLGLSLKHVDPALPFALASVAILASSGGLVWAERQLAQSTAAEGEPGEPLPFASPLAIFLMIGLFVAVLGFQVHVALNAAAQIKRVGDPSWLPLILPVFWAGFAFGLLPAGMLGKRLGEAHAVALGCSVGALALAAGAASGTIPTVAGAHALAGAGWALAMANAIGLAGASGRRGAEGRYTGLFFSLLAFGTLARIALGIAGTPQALAASFDWLPVIAWVVAALVLFQLGMRRRT
jgi:hypothetical protein